MQKVNYAYLKSMHTYRTAICGKFLMKGVGNQGMKMKMRFGKTLMMILSFN